MTKANVSVLMPAYNAAEHVSIAIQSILDQTYTDFEFIIYNDGSTDNTLSILRNFEQKDHRIKIINSEINQGLTKGRNILFQAASCHTIAWLDSDDLAYPNRLELQMNFLDTNPEFVGVSCWARVIDFHGLPTGGYIKSYIKNKHLKAVSLFVNYFVVSGMTMYKSAVPASGFDAFYSPAEDYDLFVRVLEMQNLAILPKVLVDYRTHATNLTATQSDKMKNAVVEIQKRQLEKLDIHVSKEASMLHYNICFGGSVDMAAAEKWLIQMKRANEKRQIVDEKSLNFVLSHRWLKLFEKNEGLKFLFRCVSSELFQMNLYSLLLLLKIIVSKLK